MPSQPIPKFSFAAICAGDSGQTPRGETFRQPVPPPVVRSTTEPRGVEASAHPSLGPTIWTLERCHEAAASVGKDNSASRRQAVSRRTIGTKESLFPPQIFQRQPLQALDDVVGLRECEVLGKGGRDGDGEEAGGVGGGEAAWGVLKRGAVLRRDT